MTIFQNSNRYLTAFLAIIVALAFAATTDVEAQQLRVLSNLIEEHDVQPGNTARDVIYVENQSDREREVEIFLEDTGDRSNDAWIDFTPEILIVPPNSRRAIEYTISVPDDLRGSYWSNLVVREIGAGSVLSRDTETGEQIRISQNVEYAITMLTTAPPNERSMAVDNADFKDNVLSFDLVNDGIVTYRPDTRIEVRSNTDGSVVKELEGKNYLMHPERVVTEEVDLSDLEAGTYRAIMISDLGGRGNRLAMPFEVVVE